MSNKLKQDIVKLERKIATNDLARQKNVSEFKSKIENPWVVAMTVLGGSAFTIYLLRKKRLKSIFAYLTSLSLVTANLYQKFKMGMHVVNKIQQHRKQK